jgi:hypothetical protein
VYNELVIVVVNEVYYVEQKPAVEVVCTYVLWLATGDGYIEA